MRRLAFVLLLAAGCGLAIYLLLLRQPSRAGVRTTARETPPPAATPDRSRAPAALPIPAAPTVAGETPTPATFDAALRIYPNLAEQRADGRASLDRTLRLLARVRACLGDRVRSSGGELTYDVRWRRASTGADEFEVERVEAKSEGVDPARVTDEELAAYVECLTAAYRGERRPVDSRRQGDEETLTRFTIGVPVERDTIYYQLATLHPPPLDQVGKSE